MLTLATHIIIIDSSIDSLTALLVLEKNGSSAADALQFIYTKKFL